MLALSAGAARADDAPRLEHRLSLGVGVPIPFEAYGSDASLQDAGVDLAFLLHARAGYAVNPFASMPALVLGARSSVSTATVTDGELSLWGWVVLVGPLAGARVAIDALPGTTLTAGAGPALSRSGFRIDTSLHREFWTAAFFGFFQLSFAVTEPLELTFDAGLEHVRPAPEDETFFNQRLGSTTLLTLALGVELVL